MTTRIKSLRFIIHERLEVEYIKKIYKSKSIATAICVGIHKVSLETIAIFSGNGYMSVVIIDPQSKNFLKVLRKRPLPSPAKYMFKLIKKSEAFMKKHHYDNVTSMAFDENQGILISFFPGYFKMFEPMNFKQIWFCETDSLKKTTDKPKATSNNDLQ